MPIDPKQRKDLESAIALGRKKELPFGICLGKKPDATVWVSLKTKSPEVNGKMAKKDGETGKFTYGVMSVKSKDINLVIHGKMLSGMVKKLKEFLKAAGIKMKIKVFDLEGNALEAEDDEDDGAEAKAGAGPAPEPDPQQDKWKAVAKQVANGIKKVKGIEGIDLTETLSLWGAAVKQAEAGAYAKALSTVQNVAVLLKAATVAAKEQGSATNAQAKKWQDASAKLAPLVAQMLEGGFGDSKKINAVWLLAKAKASATPPDYAVALKAVGALAQLLTEAKKAAAAAPQKAAAAPEMAGAGAGAAPAPESPAAPQEGTNPGGAKIADIEAKIKALETQMARYDALISGSGEPIPPKWLSAVQGAKALLAPMKADAGKIDDAKLDTTLKALTVLEKTITDGAAKKAAWKAAYELFKLRLTPLDHHPQAAAPEVKPVIDAIKADLAKAVAKATAHDHAGALKALEPLPARCTEAETMADGFAEWKVLDAPRKALAQTYLGANSAIPAITALMRKMEDTYTQAVADAAAKKYKDAVAKLDLIPGIFDKLNVDFQQETTYNNTIADHDPRIAAIDGKGADVRAPVQKSIDEFKTRYAASKIAVTGDYKKSVDIQADLWRILDFIETEIAAIELWQAALKDFDLKLAGFKAHAGASGIQDVILAMERDHTAALAEASAMKHSTATAVLGRSKADWPATTALAVACAAYLTARKTAQEKIDALKTRPEAASLLEQATALLSVAGTQALNKNFEAAKVSAEEAAKRADAAKDAADTQDKVSALNKTGELDKIDKDWAAAHKVYTDIRQVVATKDSSNTFAALLTAADGVVEKGKAAHGKKVFDDARAYLDSAIGQVRATLVLVLGHGPYEAHFATVGTEIAALDPLNVDDCLKPQIAAAKALQAEATALAAAPKYDYPAAEKKLVEASGIVARATADAALYATVKTDITSIESIQTAINANNVAKTAMPKRLAALQKMLDDIKALVAAGKFGEAEQKARIGAAMKPAYIADIATVQACINTRKSWHDNWLPQITGPGKEAGAKAYAKVQAKLAIHTGYMADELFDIALNALDEVSWAVSACDTAIKEAATYAPVKLAADAVLNPLKANPSPAIAPELQKIVAIYDKAVADAAEDNYFSAQKAMATIPEACKDLPAKDAGFKAFAPPQQAALDVLVALKSHKQADAVAAMIERLQGKYETALKYADSGDYATAQKMMQEIIPAAKDAIGTADRHGLLEATTALIAGDDESAPWWPQIQAAKLAITLVSKRDHAEVAQAKIDEAFAKIEESRKDGQEDSVAKAALKAALEACNTADAIISQYQFHLAEIDAARALLTTLGTHAQKDYIAADLAEMGTALDAAAAKAGTGTDVAGVSARIEAIMDKYHRAVALADGYSRYLDVRAEPDVEARLAELEAHDHRYAIKASIDTLRAKLQKAADEIGGRNPEAAIALLEEARALGTSAFVTAQMTGNIPPSEADLKKIISGPGGTDELDAIVDKLPEEAQRAVLKVAFKVRYGCDIENFNNQNLSIPVPDGSAKGPNILAFYKAMEDLPLADTLDNDSMRKFSVMDANGDGSFYQGDDKRIVMDEGSGLHSGTRDLGSPTEVEVTDDDCKLANDDPVSYFNWNTLHEVGHAVDDKQNYMVKNGSNASHGGWTAYGTNVKPIAEKIKDKYKYDLDYIVTYMAGNNNPAIPEKPAGEACSDEEWESRRLAVRDHISMARNGNNPWASMSAAKKLAIDGVVYQESYDNDWHAYKLSARGQGVSGYQFRAPGEWFSEVYAAYHSGKLKPNHPAVKWLEKL